jgi:hypothetical protein
MTEVVFDPRLVLTVVALIARGLSSAIRAASEEQLRDHAQLFTMTRHHRYHDDLDDYLHLTEPIPGPGVYAGVTVALSRSRGTDEDGHVRGTGDAGT